MVHTTAGMILDAKLATIIHDKLVTTEVPSDYTIQHGFRYKLVDYRVTELIKIFGEPTNIYSTTIDSRGNLQHGYAIWRSPQAARQGIPSFHFVKKIIVKDHLLLHNNHVDFLFTKIDMTFQDADTTKQAGMISDSITVNTRYQTNKAGCHFLTANLVSHVMAWRVAMGEMQAWKARGLYKSLIAAGREEATGKRFPGEELMMPVHASLIAYLQDMHAGYIHSSEIAEAFTEEAMLTAGDPTSVVIVPDGSLTTTIPRSTRSAPDYTPSVGSVLRMEGYTETDLGRKETNETESSAAQKVTRNMATFLHTDS